MSTELWNHAGEGFEALKGDVESRRRALGLPIDLRRMGLVRTIEWLEQKSGGPKVVRGLCRFLGIERSMAHQQLAAMNRRSLLRLHRQSIAYAEALHLIVKAHKEAS